MAVDHLDQHRGPPQPNPEEYRKHRAAGTGVDYAEGIKLTDARRTAVYFAKYGTAETRNTSTKCPPSGSPAASCARTAAGTMTRPATNAQTAAAWKRSWSTPTVPAACVTLEAKRYNPQVCRCML